jgi:hypothetical protein
MAMLRQRCPCGILRRISLGQVGWHKGGLGLSRDKWYTLYSELLHRIREDVKKAVAITLIVCFALLTVVGILQQIMAGPTMNRIPPAFLIASLCGLFFSVLSMRPIFLSKKMLTVSVAIAVVLVVCFVLRPEPPVRGARDARRDTAHGRYILLDDGFPFGVRPETEQCLHQHGLEVRVVGLDIMDKSELPYYESYISVMGSAIKSKFGPDVFEQCENAARKGGLSAIRMRGKTSCCYRISLI